MKQILSIFAFVVFGAACAIAQPVMTIESTVVDYGTIDQNSDPFRYLHFTNTGDKPLIIKNAKGSCGCTTPEVPKEPILPGEKGQMKIRYATDRVGAINKTVTITTNEPGATPDAGMERVVQVKGEVKAAKTQDAVPASTGGLKN